MVTFSDRLKSLRHEHKISQIELAKLTGISNTNISNWEIGRNDARPNMLDILANFFDVSYPYLLGFSNERHETPKRYYGGKMIGFNERIKELRIEKKLSIRALSQMTGISKSAIGDWEVSGAVPKIDKLDVLAKFFDVSYPYLLGFSNERHETPKRYYGGKMVGFNEPNKRYMKNIDKAEVGKRIKKIRNERSETLLKFASQIDSKVSHGLVLHWEAGDNLPTNERLIKIAELGKVTLGWLLFGQDEENLQNYALPKTANIAAVSETLLKAKFFEGKNKDTEPIDRGLSEILERLLPAFAESSNPIKLAEKIILKNNEIPEIGRWDRRNLIK